MFRSLPALPLMTASPTLPIGCSTALIFYNWSHGLDHLIAIVVVTIPVTTHMLPINSFRLAIRFLTKTFRVNVFT